MNLFEKAARVFPGGPDPETGLRVLRLATRNAPPAGVAPGGAWRTLYHQMNPFRDGGRRVLLHSGGRREGRHEWMLDLETGGCEPLAQARPGLAAVEFSPGGRIALVDWTRHLTGTTVILVDSEKGTELNRLEVDGWLRPQVKFLSDTVLCVGVSQGEFYKEPCFSRFYRVDASGAPPSLMLEESNFFCNHMMPRPGHPNEFSYDRWPSPMRPITVVTRLRTLDGSVDRPVPLADDAPPIGPIWGGQRDHYLWSHDGRHILSYFSTGPEGLDDHFDFGWWLSRWDVETGHDAARPYPPERWGCNFAVTPDSRHVITAGGRGYQCLYRVDATRLDQGWNEQKLCAYAHSEEERGINRGPFHMPHVLPDGSAAIFSAGWPGPDDGVYLAELPPD